MVSWFVLLHEAPEGVPSRAPFSGSGLSVLLPALQVERANQAVFPCYVFLRFEYPEQFKLVKYTRGIRRVVGNDAGAVPPEDRFIEELQSREIGGLIELEKYGVEPSPGDEIEVADGPWKGLRGVF